MKNKKNNQQANKSKSIKKLMEDKDKKENPIYGMNFDETMKRIVRVKPAKK